MTRARAGLWVGLIVLALLAAMAAKGLLIAPPAADTPTASGFDTSRALARLERILGDEAPHPVDSAANDAVRARILAEMRAIGLTPEVRDDFACNGSARSRNISCARVRNIIARFGPEAGAPILLAAHYDSSPLGPGAADDGIGIAVILETAAQLRAESLQRPVAILLTDGEEAGLIGARSFLARDPLADQAGAILNFEARGVTGPALMFETSSPNGAAIAALTGVSRPAANSMMADMGKLIPNSTDIEVLREREGWTILNWAILGNETRYHTAGDTLAALAPASVRHMGDQALTVARTLARGQAADAPGETMYMDLIGRHLIAMPRTIGLVLLGGTLLAFGWLGARRGIGRPLLVVAAAMLGAVALTALGQFLVSLFRAGDYTRAFPEAISLAIHASALAAGLIALLWLGRGIARARLRVAAWLLFLIAGGVASLVAPGGAILFLPPPLVLLAGIALARRWPRAEPIAAVAAAILGFLILAPILHLSEMLLRHGSAWQFAPLSLFILLPFLIEARPLLDRLPRWSIAGALDLPLLAFVVVALVPAYSAARPQHFGIEYLTDGEAARWLVNHDGARLPDAFAGFEPGYEPPFSARRRQAAEAPSLPLPAPELTVIGRQTTDTGRRVRVRVASNGASQILLRLPPEAEARIAGTGTYRRPFGRGAEDAPFWLRCFGRACHGQVFDIEIGASGPVDARLIGQHPGLPPEAAPFVAARPDHAGPQYLPDARYAVRAVRF